MIPSMKNSLPILLAFGLIASASAEVKLAANFSDQMIFQQGTPIAVWGKAGAGETVKVRMSEAEVTGKADASGNWQVTLPAREAATGLDLQVNEQTLRNIAIGEVWIVAGGSNVAWPLAQSRQIQDQEMLNLKAPGIRLFEPGRGWREAIGETIGSFPAVGWFFAQELEAKLKVPVGVIALTEAGSKITQWPDALFDRLVKPWASFSVAGVIWYQGESDGREAATYEKRLIEWIKQWRREFRRETLPFYLVRLADYGLPQREPVQADGGWPLLREAQEAAAKLPHTVLVTAPLGPTDGAMDLHDIERKQLGIVLAQRAMLSLYGQVPPKKGPEGGAPIFERMEIDGSNVRLVFQVAPGGFQPDAQIPGFAIREKNGEWKWARAELKPTGDSKDLTVIELSSPEVTAPEAVRYNWASNPIGRLKDRSGRLVGAFRTDH